MNGMNHSVKDLASHMHINYKAKCVQDVGGEECKLQIISSGLVHIRHSQQATQFNLMEHLRLPALPYPAPPPKLHYSTWWRSVTRRLYRANASWRLKTLKLVQAGVPSHPPESQN